VTIGALTGAVVRNADACAQAWPGYWSAEKPFGFTRQADSSIYVYLPAAQAPPRPYATMSGTHVPPEVRGRLFVRRGYPDGFSGIDIHFRVGESPMLPVVHAFTAAPEPVIETLYHEGFRAHQQEHFTPIPDARPTMGPVLNAVRLEGGTPAEYEALAEAERKALSAALAAPGEDSLRAVLRTEATVKDQNR
jgi:hypothetical protein